MDHFRYLGWVGLCTALTLSCDNDRSCERERLKLLEAYSSLREVATRNKLHGIDKDAWTLVENRFELLESSFATEQVTWRPAEKAKGEVESTLTAIHGDSPESLEFFKRSAEETFALQDQLASKCK